LKSRIQVSSARAVSAQKPSGSSIDRRYCFSYAAASLISARAVNSLDGGKRRASRDTDWIVPVAFPSFVVMSE
jgi:hypothetical protein